MTGLATIRGVDLGALVAVIALILAIFTAFRGQIEVTIALVIVAVVAAVLF